MTRYPHLTWDDLTPKLQYQMLKLLLRMWNKLAKPITKEINCMGRNYSEGKAFRTATMALIFLQKYFPPP